MTFSRRLLLGLLLLLPSLAAADDFPTKPIRLIVPFPAGGPNDIIARVVGQRMSEIAGQRVLIDNRGGQGGVLGTDGRCGITASSAAANSCALTNRSSASLASAVATTLSSAP